MRRFIYTVGAILVGTIIGTIRGLLMYYSLKHIFN